MTLRANSGAATELRRKTRLADAKVRVCETLIPKLFSLARRANGTRTARGVRNNFTTSRQAVLRALAASSPESGDPIRLTGPSVSSGFTYRLWNSIRVPH